MATETLEKVEVVDTWKDGECHDFQHLPDLDDAYPVNTDREDLVHPFVE
jgi:hypothetical protein